MPDGPALLFDDIKGFPRGFRVFTNAITNPQRAALALGLDPALRPLDALKAWMEKRKTLEPHQPVTVKDAAFLAEHHDRRRRRPRASFRRRSGTATTAVRSSARARSSSCAIPDGGWINASIYRVQVHGRNRVTVQFDHAGRHGAIIAKKYWDQGKPCPVAVVNGEDPALFIAGFEYLPAGQSEYEFAGAIKGAPIEVVAGPQTGLPIPAHAEIVFEGHLLPMSETTLPEGPFGEFTGYYAAEARPGPVMEVTAIYHRDDPILLGSPPMKPPRFHFGLPFRAATIWANLDAAGVTDVVGAWQHVSQLMTVVALKQRYDGHAKRAALVAAAHSYMARVVVVVDEDVDPSNLARRDVGGGDPLRAVRADRHRPQRLELGARSAHSRRRQGARHHLALQGDHRGLPAVPLDRQVPADLGTVARRGARDRGEVGGRVEGTDRDLDNSCRPHASVIMAPTGPAPTTITRCRLRLHVAGNPSIYTREISNIEGWNSSSTATLRSIRPCS